MAECYAKMPRRMQERKALDATAYATVLALTAPWGFQQVTVKWIAHDVSR
jgi:hypothetical protein